MTNENPIPALPDPPLRRLPGSELGELAELQTEEPPPNDAEAAAVRETEAFAWSYLPNHLRYRFNHLHRHLFLRRVRKTAKSLEERRGATDVVLAPRGAAKSTILTLLFPVQAIVRQTERYILILSATHRQARIRLDALRNALRTSEPLGRKWPVLRERWARNSAESIEVMGVRVDAYSAASEIRGISFGPWRPTWIILDDVEEGRRIGKLEYRERTAEWVGEVVDHLGDRYTNIDLIGTLLHRDALPRRMADRPDVRFRIYQAIESESEPASRVLWEQWSGILRNTALPGRADEARAYFESRREAMVRGSRVLWPEKEDYYDLQFLRLRIGVVAFNKEKQNLPPPEEGGYFDMDLLRQFTVMGEALVPVEQKLPPGMEELPVVSLRDLTIYGFLDPARGRARGGAGAALDYAAIATVGVDGKGRCFVLDVWMERAPTSRQVLKVFDLHARWNYARFGVETNAFQHMLLEHLEHERVERRRRGEVSDLALQGFERYESKHHRLMRLEGFVANGWIAFCRDLPEEFFRQLEAYPGGRHDDGPDAVEGAVMLARGRHRKREHRPLIFGATVSGARNY